MFTVTDKASEVIKEFLKDKEANSAIRVLVSMGWSGPALGMALDEPKDEDQVIDEKGIKFVIDKALLNQAQPINVDFIETPRGSGFQLTSALPKAEGSCGSSCSGC